MSSVQIVDILALVLALAIAIIGHEIMHGYVAYRYGDMTAKLQNRLSINPISHIDPVGTILIPVMLYLSHAGFLFGWAKPVPINESTVLRNGGHNGVIAVSLAGIVYNFSLAILSYVLLKFMPHIGSIGTLFLSKLLYYSVIYNVVLGIFNLYPIPPLDGSHVLSHLFAKMGIYSIVNMFNKFSQYGMIILMVIIATPLSSIIFKPIELVLNSLFG